MKTTKLTTDNLKPGMKLAVNIYWPDQRSLLIKKGTVLSEELIYGLKKRDISIVLVEEKDITAHTSIRLPLPPDAKRKEGIPFTYPESLEERIFLDYQGKVILKIDDPVIESTKKKAVNTARKILQDITKGGKLDVQAAEETANQLIYAISLNKSAFLNVAGVRMIDEYTFVHSVNVAAYTTIIAREYGYEGTELETVCIGAFLHDVGKMLIDPKILNKPGKLTDEEFSEVKTHSEKGYNILITNGINEEIAQLAHGHHERCNGSGYPSGRTIEQFPLSAQMAAIADVYDALTSDRVYKKAIDANSAMSIIVSESDKYFNMELVSLFQRSIGIYPVGSLVRLNNGYLARVLEQNEGIVRPIIQVCYDNKGTELEDNVVLNLMDNGEVYIVEGHRERAAA
jgi:putative nucleotidyltransferase with HDIG domain